ncbi:Wzz/FepE/Etk N-terminal domain-containing protein [Mucilaginibacter lutimaris]|uniref:Wzz/FepE/Etk N-terminal domain-containing protein n=1 Tax=Mucilaginibacter lutimaris TaxID=931629 RepID=A0ABW2ZEL2_9SPHI
MSTEFTEDTTPGTLQQNISGLFNYLRSKRRYIIFTALVFAVGGLILSFIKKPAYTAESSFVLDNNAGSGMGNFASIAALAGVSMDNGSGVFSADNIVELYRSRTLLENTLLTRAAFGNESELLIDRYIASQPKWRDLVAEKHIKFTANRTQRDRTADSVLYEVVKEIRKKALTVDKLEKKTIITVSVTSKDELFAKNFNEQLVGNVNALFVQIKSAKAAQNVKVLQRQTDSVKRTLNANMQGAAAALDDVPYANPLEQSLKVPSQRKSADLQANAAVYAELIKNLELAKLTLLRETPLIQSIDKPQLPLEKEKISKVIYTIAGGITGAVLITIWFIIWGLFYKKQIN